MTPGASTPWAMYRVLVDLMFLNAWPPYHFQDMAAERINQICVASPCCHDASCALYCWDSRFQMEPALVIDLRHGQGSDLGGRCVQDFLLRRIGNIIESGPGLY